MARFLLRFSGLTGLLIAVAAAVYLGPLAAKWTDFSTVWRGCQSILAGDQGKFEQATGIALLIGLAVAGCVLLVETISGAQISAGRRRAFGANVVAQVILAAAVLVLVNIFSF